MTSEPLQVLLLCLWALNAILVMRGVPPKCVSVAIWYSKFNIACLTAPCPWPVILIFKMVRPFLDSRWFQNTNSFKSKQVTPQVNCCIFVLTTGTQSCLSFVLCVWTKRIETWKYIMGYTRWYMFYRSGHARYKDHMCLGFKMNFRCL